MRAARQLRAEQTPSKALLWERLRDRRQWGVKFRRQHPVGAFVLDFYCTEHHLAVEIDGGVHETLARQARDQSRQEILEEAGIRFVRFRSEDVMADLEGVLAAIGRALTPGPSPAVRERGNAAHVSPSPTQWERGPGGEG